MTTDDSIPTCLHCGKLRPVDQVRCPRCQRRYRLSLRFWHLPCPTCFARKDEACAFEGRTAHGNLAGWFYRDPLRVHWKRRFFAWRKGW